MSDGPEYFDLISLDFVADPTFGAQRPGPHVVAVHPASACVDDPTCCIHNPSQHPLRHRPLNWRADRGLMERICEHGIGHPDPDDLAHKRRIMTPAQFAAGAWDVHGCDLCCKGFVHP